MTSSILLYVRECMQGAMTQCRRALKADGLFLACMWGGNTLQVRLGFSHYICLRAQEIEIVSNQAVLRTWPACWN